MIGNVAAAGRAFSIDRPAFQWDALHGPGALTVRLFGRLSGHELEQVAQAIAQRSPSPRVLVCIDFEQVEHVDYRALPDFIRALTRQQNRGAGVCFVGLSRYVRNLFDVAGQGPLVRQLEWKPRCEPATPRRPLLGFTTRMRIPGDERRGFWR